MTDTTKAPEVAWLWPTSRKPVPAKDRKHAKWEEGRWTPYDTSGSHRGSSGKVKYTRTDLSNELIAAAIEASADLIIQNAHDYYTNPGEAQRSVRTFASAVHEWLLDDIISIDAHATLAARDKQVREAALRESDAEIKRLRGALEDITEGEPEWPNDPAKELEWCRNRALTAYQKETD